MSQIQRERLKQKRVNFNLQSQNDHDDLLLNAKMNMIVILTFTLVLELKPRELHWVVDRAEKLQSSKLTGKNNKSPLLKLKITIKIENQ